MSQRLAFLDYTKGFAILLLLLSHSLTNEGRQELVKTWIFAFHMPIFFVICGYLVYLKHPLGLSPGKHLTFLRNRQKNIIEPYIFFGFILIVFFSLLNLISGTNSWEPICQKVFNWVTLRGVESMWFLPVYFFAEYSFLCSVQLLKEKGAMVIAFALLVLFLLFGDSIIPWQIIQIKRILIGYIYIGVGYYFAKIKIHEHISLLFAILIMLSCSILVQFNPSSSMEILNNPFLYFGNSIGMSCATLALFKCWENIKTTKDTPLLFFGQNTLIILCTNNIVIEVLRLIDFKLTGNLLLRLGLVGGVLFFILLTLSEIPVIRFFQDKIPRK